MGHQIIKQPDGKYAIWSSVVDDFIAGDLDRADVLIEFAQDAFKESIHRTSRLLELVDAGGKPYHQFTLTYEKAMERRESVHGPKKGQSNGRRDEAGDGAAGGRQEDGDHAAGSVRPG